MRHTPSVSPTCTHSSPRAHARVLARVRRSTAALNVPPVLPVPPVPLRHDGTDHLPAQGFAYGSVGGASTFRGVQTTLDGGVIMPPINVMAPPAAIATVASGAAASGAASAAPVAPTAVHAPSATTAVAPTAVAPTAAASAAVAPTAVPVAPIAAAVAPTAAAAAQVCAAAGSGAAASGAATSGAATSGAASGAPASGAAASGAAASLGAASGTRAGGSGSGRGSSDSSTAADQRAAIAARTMEMLMAAGRSKAASKQPASIAPVGDARIAAPAAASIAPVGDARIAAPAAAHAATTSIAGAEWPGRRLTVWYNPDEDDAVQEKRGWLATLVRFDSEKGLLVRFDECAEEDPDREAWVDENPNETESEDEWAWLLLDSHLDSHLDEWAGLVEPAATAGPTLPLLPPRRRTRLIDAINEKNKSQRLPSAFVPFALDLVLVHAEETATKRLRQDWAPSGHFPKVCKPIEQLSICNQSINLHFYNQRLTNPLRRQTKEPMPHCQWPSVSNDGAGSAFLASVNQSPSPFAAPVSHDGVWVHTSCCES